jgi:hypothetical protein
LKAIGSWKDLLAGHMMAGRMLEPVSTVVSPELLKGGGMSDVGERIKMIVAEHLNVEPDR